MQKLSASLASLAEDAPDSSYHLVDDIIAQANEVLGDAKSNVVAAVDELHALLGARGSVMRLVGWDLLDMLVPRLFPNDESHDSVFRFLESICRECVPRELFLSIVGHIQQLALTMDTASCATAWPGRVALVRLLGIVLRRVPHSGRSGQTRGDLISQAWPVLLDWLTDLSAELADREDALLMAKQSTSEPLSASELHAALDAGGLMQMQQSYLSALTDVALSLTADCVAARDQARQTTQSAGADGTPVHNQGKQAQDVDAERSTLLGFVFALLRQQTFIDTLEQLVISSARSKPPAQAQVESKTDASALTPSPRAGGRGLGRALCLAACQLGADLDALCGYFSARARAQAATAAADLDDWDDDDERDVEPDADPDPDPDPDAADDSNDSRVAQAQQSSAPALPTWSVDGVAASFLHMLTRPPTPENPPATAAAAVNAVSVGTERNVGAFAEAMNSMPPAVLFVSVARYAGHLMSNRALAPQATGLTLLASLIQRTPPDTLSRQQLQDPDTGLWGLFQVLTSFAVTCPLSVLRARAQPALGWYMARFDPEARWELVASGLRECPFPSVTGLLLQQLKNDMLKTWPQTGSGTGTGQQAGGAPSADAASVAAASQGDSGSGAGVVSPAVVVALGELISRPGDLGERLDAIVAALNLLRFILIRDRDTDFTRVHALAPAFTAQHLVPLRTKLAEAGRQTERLMSNADSNGSAELAAEPEPQSGPFLVTGAGPGAPSQTAGDRESLLLAQSRLALAGDLLDRVLELTATSSTGISGRQAE